jgi:hypothetical protein
VVAGFVVAMPGMVQFLLDQRQKGNGFWLAVGGGQITFSFSSSSLFSLQVPTNQNGLA